MPSITLKVTRPSAAVSDHPAPELGKPLSAAPAIPITCADTAGPSSLQACDRPTGSLSMRRLAPRAAQKTSSRLTCMHEPGRR
jgi:hypothetical protein